MPTKQYIMHPYCLGKVFFVKNYVGGTITGGINIGYLMGGQKSNAFINIGTRESSVWNKLVMSN